MGILSVPCATAKVKWLDEGRRNWQPSFEAKYQPAINHISQIVAAFFKCLATGPYPFKLWNFSVVWLFIIDNFIFCPS